MFQSASVVGRHHLLIGPSSARALIGSLKMVKTKSSHYYSTNEQQPKDSPTELDNNKHNNANPKGEDDVMTHSFGEAYASRSEEEGFGGTNSVNNNTTSEDDKMMNDDSSNRVN